MAEVSVFPTAAEILALARVAWTNLPARKTIVVLPMPPLARMFGAVTARLLPNQFEHDLAVTAVYMGLSPGNREHWYRDDSAARAASILGHAHYAGAGQGPAPDAWMAVRPDTFVPQAMVDSSHTVEQIQALIDRWGFTGLMCWLP